LLAARVLREANSAEGLSTANLTHACSALGEARVRALGQCCEKYIRTQKVTNDSFSGGDLEERSDELRLPLSITPG
jgi:hypothetical protein